MNQAEKRRLERHIIEEGAEAAECLNAVTMAHSRAVTAERDANRTVAVQKAAAALTKAANTLYDAGFKPTVSADGRWDYKTETEVTKLAVSISPRTGPTEAAVKQAGKDKMVRLKALIRMSSMAVWTNDNEDVGDALARFQEALAALVGGE